MWDAGGVESRTNPATAVGRQHALSIFSALIDVRDGAQADYCRNLIAAAAREQPIETIAQGFTIAESILRRLATATNSTERQALEAVLADIDDTARGASAGAQAEGRRVRRARSRWRGN